MDKAIDPQTWLAQANLELEVAKHLEQEFIPKPLETSQALNHAEEILNWATEAIKKE